MLRKEEIQLSAVKKKKFFFKPPRGTWSSQPGIRSHLKSWLKPQLRQCQIPQPSLLGWGLNLHPTTPKTPRDPVVPQQELQKFHSYFFLSPLKRSSRCFCSLPVSVSELSLCIELILFHPTFPLKQSTPPIAKLRPHISSHQPRRYATPWAGLWISLACFSP